MKIGVTPLILFTLFSLNTFAEDYTQWGLPEGARVRLGKGSINEIAYSPDGTLLAVASSIGIWMYDMQTYQEVALLTGHTSSVNSVSFSPDGNKIATGSHDSTIRLWDVATGAHIRTLTGHTDIVTSVSFSPDGNKIATGSRDGTILLWELTSTAAPALLAAVNRQGVVNIQETILLRNYPNPFNPETWIPYHLADAADVQITIYDIKGAPVRQLAIGYQPAGYYTNRAKAAYWDGYNESGESVASGVYFYQLRAGDYIELRRMVILK